MGINIEQIESKRVTHTYKLDKVHTKYAHQKFTLTSSGTNIRRPTETPYRSTNLNFRRRMSKRGRHHQIQSSNISRNLVQHGERTFHLATKREPMHHSSILRSTREQ